MRKRRQSIRGKDWHSNGEGMNLDTLFLRGTLDLDLYCRYLREYSRQSRRRGKGCIAVGRIVNGRMYYEMTDRSDYPYRSDNFCYDGMTLPSDNELEQLGRSFDGNWQPDYRNSVVRAIDKADTPVHVPYVGDFNLPSTSWAVCGHDQTPYPDDENGQRLDGLLKDMEEGGTSL